MYSVCGGVGGRTRHMRRDPGRATGGGARVGARTQKDRRWRYVRHVVVGLRVTWVGAHLPASVPREPGCVAIPSEAD